MIFLSLMMIFHLVADDNLTLVAVGDAKLEKNKVVISSFTPGSKTYEQIVANDLSFYQDTFAPSSGRDSSYGNFSDKSASYAIHLKTDSNQISYTFGDLNSGSTLDQGTLSMSSGNDRAVAHQIADAFYRKVTNQPSIFLSQIYFVTDLGSKQTDPIKDLYVMDFDGGNKKKLTNHRGIVLSPAVSYAKDKVIYLLIQGGVSKDKNVSLRMLDLKTGRDALLSNRAGINSGAVFMPGDRDIALTLSHVGNAEIFIMNIASGKLTRITNHFAPDVDPSISVDGKLMTFLSGRPGQPMIYTLDPSGLEKNVKRIGFVGQFNGTPRFSPDGKEIVFSSWLDNRFDLFRLNADGSGLVRLTKDFGSNEDPTYSNDGQFIAFSSQRILSRTKAVQSVYVMGRNGEIIGNLTEGFGNCITPRWTK